MIIVMYLKTLTLTIELQGNVTVGPGSVMAGIAPRDFKVSHDMIETLIRIYSC